MKIKRLIINIFKLLIKFVKRLKPFDSNFFIGILVYLIILSFREKITQMSSVSMYLYDIHPLLFYFFMVILFLVFKDLRKTLTKFLEIIVNYIWNIPKQHILLESTLVENSLYVYAKLSNKNKEKLVKKHNDIIESLDDLKKLLKRYYRKKDMKSKYLGKLPHKIMTLNDYILKLIKNL